MKIIAKAVLVEGEIEKIFFQSPEDEMIHKSYLDALKKADDEIFESYDWESLVEGTTIAEEAKAKLAWLDSIRPQYDTSRINNRLSSVSLDPHMRGAGDIEITYPYTF